MAEENPQRVGGVTIAEEKSFENKIKRYLKDRGWWNVKFFANGYTKAGVPDILTCVNGYFVGIEVKATNGKPSELQLHQIQDIRDSGGLAFVVYPSGFKELVKILDDLSHDIFTIDMPLIIK